MRITAKGQVTIPIEVRKQLELLPKPKSNLSSPATASSYGRSAVVPGGGSVSWLTCLHQDAGTAFPSASTR